MAAAVNCYLSVTSTATPTSQDSPQPTITRPPTKIILPKKKPVKWSTGVAPGEYGGPPTTTKLRKYWGGDEDPLASDEYLWNKDFMGRMKKFIQDPVDVDTNSDPRFSSAKGRSLLEFGPSDLRKPLHQFRQQVGKMAELGISESFKTIILRVDEVITCTPWQREDRM